MAVDNVLLKTTFRALENLDTHQYQAITLADGKVANNGAEATGILINKPKNGEFATCGHFGEMKFRAGATIAADAKLTVTTSGYFVTVGSGYHLVGRSKIAVTSGSVGTGFFDFIKPIYAYSSSFIG